MKVYDEEERRYNLEMKIDMFRIETTNVFHGLAKYQKSMEEYLPVIQESEQFSLEASYRNDESPDALPFDTMMEEYEWVYGYFFPRSLRYSFVVLLFLVIEHQLNQ